MLPSLFISYSREDRAAVLVFARTLRLSYAVDVWLDTDTEPGADWLSEIEKRAKLSDFLVIWATRGGVESKYVNAEVGASQGRRVPVIFDREDLRSATALISSAQGVEVGKATPSEAAALVASALGLRPASPADSTDVLLKEVVGALDELPLSEGAVFGLRRKAYAALAKWRGRRFQVAVIALTKAGKSTTINAWLGREFLPMSNVPETARIVRIHHDEVAIDGALSTGGSVTTGQHQIRAALLEANRATRVAGQESPDIVLRARVAAFSGGETNGVAIEIIDTPGPNEAGAHHLRTRAHAVVSGADAIVYLLDYTKLNTNDESALLSLIAENRQDIVESWHDRLFFLINKIDQAGRHDLSVDDTRRFVARVLTKQLGIRVPEERVYGVAAKSALDARLVIGGAASAAAAEELAREIAGKRWSHVTQEELRLGADEVLRDSGFETVETQILSFLNTHCGSLLQRAVLAEALHSTQLASNHLTVSRAIAETEREEAIETVSALQQKLQTIGGELKRLDILAVDEQKKMKRWTGEQFKQFRSEIDRQIGALGGVRGHGVFSGAFERARDAIDSLASGPEQDEAALRASMLKMVDHLVEWAESEFDQFRLGLQREAYKHQASLINRLGAECSQLASRIDGEVASALQITIEPVPIELPMPTQLDLHDGIHKQLSSVTEAAILRERTRVKKQVREAGFCGTPVWHERWVDEYRQRRAVRLSTQLLAEFIRKKFLGAFDDSEKTALTLVARLVRDHVAEARTLLNDRLEQYRRTLEQDLETGEATSADRANLLRRLDLRIERLGELSERLRSIRPDHKARR